MLATVNIAILAFWLMAELIPWMADALAARENRHRSISDDE